MTAKVTRINVPATQPSCAIAQANDNTPEPITAVIMCALAVINVPVLFSRPSSSTLFPVASPDSTAEGLCTASKLFILRGETEDERKELQAESKKSTIVISIRSAKMKTPPTLTPPNRAKEVQLSSSCGGETVTFALLLTILNEAVCVVLTCSGSGAGCISEQTFSRRRRRRRQFENVFFHDQETPPLMQQQSGVLGDGLLRTTSYQITGLNWYFSLIDLWSEKNSRQQ
ncbi:hypothetical protein Bca4012_061698 [Brassica carinata]